MFQSYIAKISEILTNVSATTLGGEALQVDQAFDRWIDLTRAAQTSRKNIFFVGNGASAAMSSHMSADAAKNGNLIARTFSDFSLLTATSNDISYNEVFAFALNRFAEPGDTLITISSSGNSPNIIRALDVAKEIGVRCITLSGMSQGNQSRSRGELNFYVSGQDYGVVECSHQVILHYWLDTFIERHVAGG